MGAQERGGGAEILRSVISEKAFILSSSLYLHFMSWPRCNSSSNMCAVLVFECVCVCVFIRGELSVSFSLIWVDTVSRGNLFTYIQRSPSLSVSPFPLPSVLSVAYGKVFAVEMCKQTILSLPFSASVS